MSYNCNCTKNKSNIFKKIVKIQKNIREKRILIKQLFYKANAIIQVITLKSM